MMPPSTPVRRRRKVSVRKRALRSPAKRGRRVERLLALGLVAVCLAMPAVKTVNYVTREYALEKNARSQFTPAFGATRKRTIISAAAEPAVAHEAMANSALPENFTRVGHGPAGPAPVTRPWETPYQAAFVAPAAAPAYRPALAIASAPVPHSAASTGAIPLAPPPLNFRSSIDSRPALASQTLSNLVAVATSSAAPSAIPSRSGVHPTAARSLTPNITPGGFTWSGGAAALSPSDPNWTNGNNWVGGIAPAPAGNDAIAYTPTPAGATPTNVNSDYQINSLTFQGPVGGVGPDTPSYNITQTGGSDLFIAAGGISNASANAQTLTLPVYATANETWTTSNAAGRLNLPTQVYLQGANRVLTIDGAGTTAITGPVNEGTAVTAAQIIKNGTGTLILGGANTYTGGATLNAGTIELDNNAALGTGTFTVGSTGGTVTNRSASNVTIANAVALNGNLDRGVSNGALTFSGNVALGEATRTISSSDTQFDGLVFSGAISGGAGAGLTFNGNGNETFVVQGTSANTYTGPTTANGANLSLTKQGAIAVAGDLNVQNNSFVRTAGGQLASTTNLTVATNSEFDASGDFLSSANETFASLTGDSTSKVTFGNFSAQTTLTIGQGNDAGILRDGNLASARALNPAISWMASGGALVKNTGGTLILSGANTYSAGTIITGGTLLANNVAGSGTGSGAVQVFGGTLGGIGTVSGNVTVGDGATAAGTLAPGDKVVLMLRTPRLPSLQPPNGNIGTLTAGSSVTFNANGTFAVDFDSNSATADKLITLGDVTIVPGATFTAADLGSNPFAGGKSFTLIDNQGANPIAGVFNNLPDSSLVTIGQTSFQVSYEGGTGNDLVLVAVPEPGEVTLLLAALAVVGFAIRRRKQMA